MQVPAGGFVVLGSEDHPRGCLHSVGPPPVAHPPMGLPPGGKPLYAHGPTDSRSSPRFVLRSRSRSRSRRSGRAISSSSRIAQTLGQQQQQHDDGPQKQTCGRPPHVGDRICYKSEFGHISTVWAEFDVADIRMEKTGTLKRAPLGHLRLATEIKGCTSAEPPKATQGHTSPGRARARLPRGPLAPPISSFNSTSEVPAHRELEWNCYFFKLDERDPELAKQFPDLPCQREKKDRETTERT